MPDQLYSLIASSQQQIKIIIQKVYIFLHYQQKQSVQHGTDFCMQQSTNFWIRIDFDLFFKQPRLPLFHSLAAYIQQIVLQFVYTICFQSSSNKYKLHTMIITDWLVMNLRIRIPKTTYNILYYFSLKILEGVFYKAATFLL